MNAVVSDLKVEFNFTILFSSVEISTSNFILFVKLDFKFSSPFTLNTLSRMNIPLIPHKIVKLKVEISTEQNKVEISSCKIEFNFQV